LLSLMLWISADHQAAALFDKLSLAVIACTLPHQTQRIAVLRQSSSLVLFDKQQPE
jgi:hypothetical protein